MKLEAWTDGDLPAVVRFWNASFSGRRNFFPATEELFRRRVIGKKTAVERFDPAGFRIAREGEAIIGIVHAGLRPEALCKSMDPSWPGGSQGAVYLLYVDPEHRKKGVGAALWHAALEHLKEAKQVVLDGQCINPFYGNSEGPFTPWWGTPEGIAVEWKDGATQKFFARKGFAPRYKGVQLSIDIAASETPPLEESERGIAKLGFELGYRTDAYPEVGREAGETRDILAGLDFESVAVTKAGRTVGAVVFYPMKEVRENLYAIYEARVVEELRGKSLGKRLLAAAIARMRGRGAGSCEVLTIPDISPAAHKVYIAAGFQPIASWAVY